MKQIIKNFALGIWYLVDSDKRLQKAYTKCMSVVDYWMRRMLFRKPDVPEISSGGLMTYLQDIFDNDSGKVISRCSGHVRRLQDGVHMFDKAIDGLEAYEGRPDSDAIGITSESVVTDRKNRYVLALRNALLSFKGRLKEGYYETDYERLLYEKSEYERLISTVLSLNSDFKIVVLSYPDRIGAFKKSFSEIERGISSIKAELEKGSGSYNHYNTLKLHIENLISLEKEYEALNAGYSGEQQGRSHDTNREESLKRISEAEAMKAELYGKEAALSSQIKKMKGDLESLLQPIERASRKYDYGKKDELRVAHYTSDLYSRRWDAAEYSRFVGILEDLKSSILKKAVDVKNGDGIVGHIDLIIRSGIVDTVDEVRSLEGEINAIRREREACESELYRLKEGVSKGDVERKEYERELERVGELKEGIMNEKRAIERLFAEYYRRQVRIAGASDKEIG